MPGEREHSARPVKNSQTQYRQEMSDWLREPGGKRLDELFNDPLLEQAPTSPTLPPPGSEDEAWQQCTKLIDKHDDDMCKGFREEIDTLLVFAGLFSAVVTAFSVESYQWLQKQPDPSAELLARFVQVFSPNQTTKFLAAPVPATVGPGLPPSTAARINTYWFLSLTLSLSAALVGILCKEWVQEFRRDAGQTPRQYIGLRQMKFEGLEAWKVAEIISTIPLLLQAALWLFILGILELLGRLHTAVAAVVTTVAGLALLFYSATTFLPAIQYGASIMGSASADVFRWQCAYKSPQAWLVLRLFNKVSGRWPWRAAEHRSTTTANSWISFDVLYHEMLRNISRVGTNPGPSSSFRGLSWLVKTMDRKDLHNLVWHCVWTHVGTISRWTSWTESARVHIDVVHVVFSAYRLPLVEAGHHSAYTCKGVTLAHVLTYALKTTTDRNDLLLLYCQALPGLSPDDAHRIWRIYRGTRMSYYSHPNAVRKDVLYVLLRSFRSLMRTTGTTRRASPAEYGRILSDLAGHIRINRLYENELVGYLCATFLLWLRDQSPQTAHIRLIVSKLLMHVISIISARKLVPHTVPLLGLYTALLRRSVDLLCSPLPDVDWVAHIISKMGFATVFIRDYSHGPDL